MGERDLDARTDVYSLACVLYELLAGEPPYTGLNPQMVLAKRLSEPVPRLTTTRDVPAFVEQAVVRALARAPADRYESAAAFARALQAPDGTGAESRPARGRSRWRSSRLVAAGLLTVAAGLAAFFGLRHDGGVISDSVGVLPFTDLSPGGDQAYFSDGLTEELITALSRVEGIRVAARTSSFRFRGQDLDVREVGRRLRVGSLLEGSVRKDGDRLRVTAQLVNASDGYQIWSAAYDRELADVFAVQEEIALAITSALRVTLVAGGDERLRSHPTNDLEAYDLYLKGRYAWNLRTAAGMREAVQYLERSVAQDPRFAMAWAALAVTYVLAIPYAGEPRDTTWPKAKAAAEKALALDGTLGEAYTALAYGTMIYDWDWPAAEAHFRRAIAVEPSYPTGRQWYADFLWGRGRLDEALEQMEEAHRLDPLSLVIWSELGGTYYRLRRYDHAEAELRATLQLDANYAHALYVLGQVYLAVDRPEEAVDMIRRSLDLSGFQEDAAGALAYAYARSGDREAAARSLAELEERYENGTVGPYALALAHTGLGDLTQAFDYLHRAIDVRDMFLPEDFFEPLLDPLRADPRFARVEERMGLGP